MKILISLILFLAGVYIVFAYFSTTSVNYECYGSVSGSSGRQNLSVFVRLDVYRPWVGLWSDSDGSMWVEIPNEFVDYHSSLQDVGTQMQILDDGSPIGNFSKLSNTLAIQTVMGFFDGSCTVRA